MRLFIAMAIVLFLALSVSGCAGGQNIQRNIKASVSSTGVPIKAKVRIGMLTAGHRAHDDPMHPHYCGSTTPYALEQWDE